MLLNNTITTKHYRIPFKFVLGLLLLILGCLVLSVQAQQPTNTEVKGVHQVMDPDSQTDDLGISVPISISHPARRYPADNNFPTGPAVGESLPNIKLPNQNGEMIDIKQRKGNSNAVVVFFRSASW